MQTTSTKIAAALLAFGLMTAACSSDADDLVDDAGDAAGEVVDATEDTLVPDEGTDSDTMDDDDTMDDADDTMDDADADDDAPSDVPATVVDVALASPEFSTLVAALTEADLVETLQGDGPFTVFAPTNDAFDELFDATGITAEQLLATTDLADTLTYHVIDGVLLAETALLADGTSIQTIQGDGIDVDIVDGQVVLNGDATVTTADLVAGNGVVHIIDGVLVPPADS